MRHLTIVERLMAAVLLPLGAVVALPILASFAGAGDAFRIQIVTVAGIAGLAVLAVRALAQSIARPIAEVAATIDAIAYGAGRTGAAEPGGTCATSSRYRAAGRNSG